ncbi:MAG TPA: carboxypeptidase regulatory-like domain-containing protein, partial [Puia sp.]|nr:carboxypeptidase regulatory-like domain-containing protein [Puia sp.]
MAVFYTATCYISTNYHLSVHVVAKWYMAIEKLFLFCSRCFSVKANGSPHFWLDNLFHQEMFKKPRQIMRHFTLLTAFFLFISTAVFSQTATFTGEVIDQHSGEPLQGASVELTAKTNGNEQKGKHIISGLNGSFRVQNLATGEYRVSVEFVGYEKYTQMTTISADNKAGFKIELVHRQSSLSAVSITGGKGKGSDYASQMADRHADIIQNSVSARAIEVSPDLSVAAVTQRVSGVTLERSTNGEGQYVIIRGMDKRYIYTLINGVKIPSPDNKNRYVPLDIFPAEMLQRLEVTKSLMPDMEGDAIGGTVNMIMKDAPSKFTVNANAGLNYSTGTSGNDFNQYDHGASLKSSPRILNGPAYNATMSDFPNNAFSHTSTSNPLGFLGGLTIGGRVFDNKLGILLGGSYQNNYRYVKSVFFSTETSMSNGDVKVTDIQPRNYSIQQQRSGVNAKLDYKINDKNQVNLYVAYFDLDRTEVRIASDTNLQLGRIGPGYGRISNSYRDL